MTSIFDLRFVNLDFLSACAIFCLDFLKFPSADSFKVFPLRTSAVVSSAKSVSDFLTDLPTLDLANPLAKGITFLNTEANILPIPRPLCILI